MSETGHNSGEVHGEYLTQIIESIEKLNDEKQDTSECIKEKFAEAKSAGFDVKVIREVIKRRKMEKEKRDEHDYLRDLYECTLENKINEMMG